MSSSIDWKRLVGEEVTAEPVCRGRNSRVFRLTRTDGIRLAAKTVFSHPDDSRDRFGCECAGLALAAAAGLDVPELVTHDRSRGVIITKWVEGGTIAAPSAEDARTAAEFLNELKRVASRTPDNGLGRASEACFTGRELEGSLLLRLDRLKNVSGPPLREPLTACLADLSTALARETDRAANVLEKAGIGWDDELEKKHRTLSPSDFGFHNAIRKNDGSIVFMDFEYFGWDDPAKTVCDFMLHPAMRLDDECQTAFLHTVRPVLDSGTLTPRADAFFPLYTLKWCLIFLNEFLPCDRSRREFAACPTDEKRCREQLGKAYNYLETIHERHQRFMRRLA